MRLFFTPRNTNNAVPASAVQVCYITSHYIPFPCMSPIYRVGVRLVYKTNTSPSILHNRKLPRLVRQHCGTFLCIVCVLQLSTLAYVYRIVYSQCRTMIRFLYALDVNTYVCMLIPALCTFSCAYMLEYTHRKLYVHQYVVHSIYSLYEIGDLVKINLYTLFASGKLEIITQANLNAVWMNFGTLFLDSHCN